MCKRTCQWLGLALLWLYAGGLLAAPAATPEPRLTVAVVEFSVMGNMHEQAGAIVADLMMSAIANTGRFTLKDRLSLSAVAKIAKAQDQELGYTGLLDPKTAAELGRRYGVDAVIIGAISKPGDLITVTARLVETKTASLLRSGQIQGQDIDTIQVKVNELAAMISQKPESVATYGLTVQTEPANADIRLLNYATPYRPGVRLPPGQYELEVGQSGYTARRESVKIVDRDVSINLALDKIKYGLTVQTEPADAQVKLLNIPTVYKPGVELVPGNYEIEVTKDGYLPRKLPVQIAGNAVTVPVTLEKQPAPTRYRFTVQADPTQANVRLPNVKTPYQPGMELTPGSYAVEVHQPGYDTQRVTVNIVDRDVTLPVKLVKTPEPVKPTQYRLTVRPDPSKAQVRLVGTRTKYRPGVELPPGNYTVEVSQPGYESQQVTVRMADSDVTVPVKLVKQPEPQRYSLTVRTDPADAQVRLVGAGTKYRSGVALAPGSYTVEVSRPGYDTERVAVRIVDSDVTMPVTLNKQPEPVKPTLYQLTVRTDPADAQVRLVGTGTKYRSGVALAPGSYTVEVSRSGYDTERVAVRIVDSDVTMPVTLNKQPEPVKPTLYQLTVRTDPADAQVRLVGAGTKYRSGVALAPGSYTVEVSRSGYDTERVAVRIVDSDVTMPVTLNKQPEAVAKVTPPTPSPPTQAGVWRIGSVQIDGSISGVDRTEVQRALGRYVGQTATRDSLLSSAMQVYQSTGITLSFSVRNSASGSAQLSAQAVARLRRTYESSVPLVTRSQLERSGFGVSVE